jgi:hypothetical protein
VSAAFYYRRGTGWRSRRQVLTVALICGLLGTVALGALAAARRTDTAYGRYLRAINSSDVFVNVPGPVLPVIRQVERLPGVASGAATVGLNANPIVNGKVNDAFLTNGEFAFGWIGLRLTTGSAGIPALQRRLATLAGEVDRRFDAPPGTIRLNIRRLDIVHHEVQQGIAPQAVALAILGGLASLALLVLAGQGLAQLLDRSTPDLAGLRAMGVSRAQSALGSGLAGVIAVLAGTALAVVGAVAVSPLAPVGAVRQFDPARGVQADPLVLAGGGCALATALLAVLGVLAWRSVRPPGELPAARASSVAAAASAAGLPVTAVVGAREALERGAGRRPVPVLATLIGSVVAVMAVAMAVVFGASLTGLLTNPARYGWNWTLLMDTQGGYGSWPPAQMDRLVSGQPGVTGWSTFAFTQISIDGQNLPVLGLTRHLGSVEPPTTSGHPIGGPGQIELGVATLRQLGKRIGETVTVGSGRDRRMLTIVGTVTLPSIGLTIADHVSLGRGAMLADSTLLAAQGGPEHPDKGGQERRP